MEMCLVLTQQDVQGVESNRQSTEMCLAEKQYCCPLDGVPLGTDKVSDTTCSEFAVLPLTWQMLQSIWAAKTSDLDVPTGEIKRVNSYLLPYCNFLLIFTCFFFTSCFWSKLK